MNQSGIRLGEDLRQYISTLSASTRTLKIAIIDEVLQAQGEQAKTGRLEDDFDKIIELVTDTEAAYFLVRRDDSTDFLFISYVPDTARVKDKMTYASTRNTIIKEIGSDKIRETYFATTKSEMTYIVYNQHTQDASGDRPLTEKEKDVENIKAAESEVYATSSRKAIVSSGLSFQISTEAQEALNVLASASTSRIVALRIDVQKETIELIETQEVDIEALASHVSSSAPQYTFFSYVHEYEGTGITTQCFIYTCPSASKVKERMLYSSNRQGILSAASFKVDVKYETEELDLADLRQRIHPAKETMSNHFSRPKRPGKR